MLVLAGVLQREKQPDEQVIARACQKVAFWAEGRLLPRTAIWYAQAGALSSPSSPEHAYTVGLLCRKNSDYVRADTWYRRAIGLARRRRDAQVYAHAYMDVGELYAQRGDYARATAAFQRAFNTARRAGMRPLRARSLHSLFSVAVETNRVEEAEAYARRAFRAYPRDHPYVPKLAHDVAVFWMFQGF